MYVCAIVGVFLVLQIFSYLCTESPQEWKPTPKDIPQLNVSESLNEVSLSGGVCVLQAGPDMSPGQKTVSKPIRFEIPLECGGNQLTRKVPWEH